MPSSVIRSFTYDPGRRELLVTFTTGRRYIYSDVPEDEADRFRGAFAKGVHFNRFIRGNFSCRELDPHQGSEAHRGT